MSKPPFSYKDVKLTIPGLSGVQLSDFFVDEPRDLDRGVTPLATTNTYANHGKHWTAEITLDAIDGASEVIDRIQESVERSYFRSTPKFLPIVVEQDNDDFNSPFRPMSSPSYADVVEMFRGLQLAPMYGVASISVLIGHFSAIRVRLSVFDRGNGKPADVEIAEGFSAYNVRDKEHAARIVRSTLVKAFTHEIAECLRYSDESICFDPHAKDVR